MTESFLSNINAVKDIPASTKPGSSPMESNRLNIRKEAIRNDLQYLSENFFSEKELAEMRICLPEERNHIELTTNVENHQRTDFIATWKCTPHTEITISHTLDELCATAFAFIRIKKDYDGAEIVLKVIKHSVGSFEEILELFPKRKIGSVSFTSDAKGVKAMVLGSSVYNTGIAISQVFGEIDLLQLQAEPEYAAEQYSRFRKELFN